LPYTLARYSLCIMRSSFASLVAVLLVSATPGAQTPRLRGFSVQGSDAERALEAKFRAVPKPDNARDYMKTISAYPHHAGSPASRQVAEYILGQFTSW